MFPDKSKWTLDKINKFIDVLMEVTLCSDIQELKDHIILESIWNEAEKRLDTAGELLKNIWYNCLHLQLFCPEPIYMNDIMIKLIECLHIEEVSELQDIKWNKVATYFDGVTVIFLRKTFYKLMKVVKSRTKIKNVGEYIPILISSDNDKTLPRLKYNEGSISYIDNTNIEEQESISE